MSQAAHALTQSIATQTNAYFIHLMTQAIKLAEILFMLQIPFYQNFL